MFYTGSYSPKKENGICCFSFNIVTGEIKRISQMTGVLNPSYLALSKDKKNLYAESESPDYGEVYAFAAHENGELSFLNAIDTGGAASCHVAIDPKKQFISVANYLGGSLALFSLNSDGSLNRQTCLKKHKGKGFNANRQEASHVHFTRFLENDIVMAVDLGLDKVYFYDLDRTNSLLSMSFCFVMPAGCGPRHFVFHPQRNDIMYVVCELSSKVYIVYLDNNNCEIIDAVSTLPVDNKKESFCAAIRIMPNGTYIFASNREHNSIACFEVQKNTHKLLLRDITSLNGRTPRDFNIIGNYLIVALQDSDTLCVYSIGREGSLDLMLYDIRLKSPSCIAFVR